jgi:hypothetical protein
MHKVKRPAKKSTVPNITLRTINTRRREKTKTSSSKQIDWPARDEIAKNLTCRASILAAM